MFGVTGTAFGRHDGVVVALGRRCGGLGMVFGEPGTVFGGLGTHLERFGGTWNALGAHFEALRELSEAIGRHLEHLEWDYRENCEIGKFAFSSTWERDSNMSGRPRLRPNLTWSAL